MATARAFSDVEFICVCEASVAGLRNVITVGGGYYLGGGRGYGWRLGGWLVDEGGWMGGRGGSVAAFPFLNMSSSHGVRDEEAQEA